MISFPYADAHHHEHAELISKLDTAIDHLKQTDEIQQDNIHREIAVMLHDSLVQHILQSDLKMKMYVEAMKKFAPNFGALEDLEIDVN